MLNFTGYEPKGSSVRRTPMSVPTPGSQVVQADTLAQDLSMVSSLEEFLQEDGAVSGPQGLAYASTGVTQDDVVVNAADVVPNASSSSSGPKGLAKPPSTLSAEDEALWYDTVSDLAAENARLHELLNEKDVEIVNTKIHAENYASEALRDSRSRAENALAYQKGTFEQAHEEYASTLKDMAEAHVATSTAHLEAVANSVIGQQQFELQNASNIVANLQQHLGQAQQEIELESQDRSLIEAKAKAEVDSQKVSSKRELSSLRASLEREAEEKHADILKDRVQTIKDEAEQRHTESMSLQTSLVAELRSSLSQAVTEKQLLETELASAKHNAHDLQISLAKAESLLTESREGRQLLEKDVGTQRDVNQKLSNEIAQLKSHIDQMQASMKTSQSEQNAVLLKKLEEAERSIQLLKGNVQTLSNEIDIHKHGSGKAEKELNDVQVALRKEHEDRIAALIS